MLAIAQGVPYEGARLLTGTLGSGDVWNRELDRIFFFHEQLGTSCEDMESFAIAQVCAEMKVPVLAMRVISNSEHHPQERFNPATAELAQRFTRDLLLALRPN